MAATVEELRRREAVLDAEWSLDDPPANAAGAAAAEALAPPVPPAKPLKEKRWFKAGERGIKIAISLKSWFIRLMSTSVREGDKVVA